MLLAASSAHMVAHPTHVTREHVMFDRHRLGPARHVLLVAAVLLAGLVFDTSTTHAALPTDPPVNDVLLDMEAGAPLLYPLGLSVFNLYWDAKWNQNGQISTGVIDTATKDLVNSGYDNSLGQYGVPDITWGGSSRTHCPGPGPVVSGAAVFAVVTCEMLLAKATWGASGVPFPWGDEIMFNIIVPNTTRVADPIVGSGSCGAGPLLPSGATLWSGFHAATPVLGHPIVFTVIAAECATSMASMMRIISHEIVEAATDPLPLVNWKDTSTAGSGPLSGVNAMLTRGEVADICAVATPSFARVPLTVGTSAMEVAAYWSNFDNACVVGGDGAASVAEQVVNATFTGSGAGFGTKVDINGAPHTVPLTQAVFPGDRVTFEEGFTDFAGTTRFMRGPSCPPPLTPVSFPAPNTTANPAVTMNCPYVREFHLAVDTDPGAATPGNGALTAGGFRPEGTTVTLTADATVAAGPDSRYELRGWQLDGKALNCTTCLVTMDQPHVARALYVLQHRVQFTATGLPASTPWQVTVNGSGHGLPYEDYYDTGSTMSYSFPTGTTTATTVITLNAVSPTSPLTVSTPAHVVASYTSTHLVTVATKNLGSDSTHVFNLGADVGTASDTSPLSFWATGGTFALDVEDPVHGATGTEHYLQTLSPHPGPILNSGYSGTATYQTMQQIVDQALSATPPEILDPTIAQQLVDDFHLVEKDLGAGGYEQALLDIDTFLTDVQTNSPLPITKNVSSTMQIDALKTYHWALCQAVQQGLDPTIHTADYAHYATLWTALTEHPPLPDCAGRGGDDERQ
jgi:hypothetical protein